MFVATDKSLQMTQDCCITLQSVQVERTLLLKMYYTPVSCPVVSEHSYFKICKYSSHIIKGSGGHTHTQNTVLIKFNSKLSKLAEINKGVQHDCTLLPALLNTYLDEIITKWQKEDIKGIPLPKSQQLLTLICRQPSCNI